MKFTRRTSRTTPAFWRRFDKLPIQIQKLALRRFDRFLVSLVSVKFKHIAATTAPPYYFVRVDANYRAVGFIEDDTIYWDFIGNHDEYMRYLNNIIY